MATLVRGIWVVLFGWMPIGLQLAFGAIVALAVIVLLLKVIALVLDAIPIL